MSVQPSSECTYRMERRQDGDGNGCMTNCFVSDVVLPYSWLFPCQLTSSHHLDRPQHLLPAPYHLQLMLNPRSWPPALPPLPHYILQFNLPLSTLLQALRLLASLLSHPLPPNPLVHAAVHMNLWLPCLTIYSSRDFCLTEDHPNKYLCQTLLQ